MRVTSTPTYMLYNDLYWSILYIRVGSGPSHRMRNTRWLWNIDTFLEIYLFISPSSPWILPPLFSSTVLDSFATKHSNPLERVALSFWKTSTKPL
jgi:hypothetical protein